MDRNKIKIELSKHTLFTNHLKSLIESLLQVNNIKFHIIESRTKDIDSLSDKIDRKQIKEIDEVTDLSGIRIITYYQDEIDIIEKIIKENFIIDEANSINKSDLYKSNEFGYLSVHYIVSLNNQRKKLAEWKNFSKLKAEIQVRTVLQHSWASISHELSYKKKYEIPKQLERKLFRLAGLFELADEEFLNIRDKHKNLFDELKNIDLNNKIDDEVINLFTLNYLFTEEKLKIFNEIENHAIEGGFIIDYDEFQETNRKNYLSEIMKISKIIGIKTISDFEKILTKNEKYYEEYFKQIIFNNEESTAWYGDLQFFVSLALMFEFNNDEQFKEFEDSTKWHSNILAIIKKAVVESKKLLLT